MTIGSDPTIPGPQGGVHAGNEPAYRADPVTFLRTCQQRYGDVFRYSDQVVFTGRPDHVRQLLARTNRTSYPDPDVLHNHRPPSADHTAAWLEGRALAWQALKPRAVAAHVDAIDRALAGQLAGMASRRVGADAWAELAVRAALPACVRDPDPALAPAAAHASRTIVAVIDLGTRLPWWLPSRRRRRARSARAAFQQQLRALMERHVEPPPRFPRTVADEVLSPGGDVPPEVRERALASTVLASAEVPGTALAWLIYELGRHPDELARVSAEFADLRSVLDGLRDGGDVAALLPRTFGCVQETLRLHPPTWLMSRQLTAEVALGQWSVAPGQTVVFSPYLTHRDPRWWDSAPEEFRPERWWGTRPPHRPHAFLPFGAGPRVCFGAHLGQLVMALTAAHVATGYRLDLVDAEAVRPRFGVPLTPQGLVSVLTPH